MSYRSATYWGSGYEGPDYYSYSAGPEAVLVGVQASDIAGQQPLFGKNYYGPNYRGVDYWGSISSWTAVATAGPQTLSVQPPLEIDIGPLWTFKIQAGNTGLISSAQADQTGLFRAQATTTPNARVAEILAQQADQIGLFRAAFVGNPTTRYALWGSTQAPDVAVITATHVFSGGTAAKRYGRR